MRRKRTRRRGYCPPQNWGIASKNPRPEHKIPYRGNFVFARTRSVLERGFVYFAFFRNLASRDFFLAAAFFLITPLFNALSIAWYASLSAASEVSLSFPCVSRADLTASFIARFLRTLNTAFRADDLIAFFADFVIAMRETVARNQAKSKNVRMLA